MQSFPALSGFLCASLAMVAVSCGGGGGGGIAAAPSGPPRLQIEQPPVEISAIETEASPQIAQVSGFDVLFTGVSGSGIGVAVLDTGIMASHSEFGGRVRPGDDLQGDGDGTRDGNGHGTHAASLLAASGDGKGMLGIAPEATLYSYRILNDQGVFGGRSGNQMVPAVLGQVGEHGLPVVNNSWASIYEINDLSRTTIVAALAGELTAYRQLATRRWCDSCLGGGQWCR